MRKRCGQRERRALLAGSRPLELRLRVGFVKVVLDYSHLYRVIICFKELN
jgi:hypothetical protein